MFIDLSDKQAGQILDEYGFAGLTELRGRDSCPGLPAYKKKNPVTRDPGESPMKKTARSDSHVDAVAAVLLIALSVAFAVTWVAGQ